jgi:hypothetical protein
VKAVAAIISTARMQTIVFTRVKPGFVLLGDVVHVLPFWVASILVGPVLIDRF